MNKSNFNIIINLKKKLFFLSVYYKIRKKISGLLAFDFENQVKINNFPEL